MEVKVSCQKVPIRPQGFQLVGYAIFLRNLNLVLVVFFQRQHCEFVADSTLESLIPGPPFPIFRSPVAFDVLRYGGDS